MLDEIGTAHMTQGNFTSFTPSSISVSSSSTLVSLATSTITTNNTSNETPSSTSTSTSFNTSTITLSTSDTITTPTSFETTSPTLNSSSTYTITSNITSTISPEITTTSNNDLDIYSCNFNTICNGQLIKDPLSIFQLSNQVHIPNTDYFITDFSSINEPTLTQNKHCIIPFVYNNVKYDYCAYIFGKFQCKIDNIKNSFDNCYSNGSFLYGRTSNNGDKFESTYKSKVNIPRVN